MKNILLILLSLLSIVTVQAQADVANIIKQVNNAYANNKAMLITTTYKMYVNHTTTNVYETLQGSVKKQGFKIAFKLKDIERLENAARRIIINHENKTIFVEPNNKERQDYVMDADLSKFLNENNIGQVEDKGSSWQLSINMETHDIEKIQIIVNKSSFFIEKMITFYRQAVRLNTENLQIPEEKPRMEISFQVNTNPSFTATDFAESKFIKVVGGKVVLSDQLKNEYHLMSLD